MSTPERFVVAAQPHLCGAVPCPRETLAGTRWPPLPPVPPDRPSPEAVVMACPDGAHQLRLRLGSAYVVWPESKLGGSALSPPLSRL